jgi:hypothetical protein
MINFENMSQFKKWLKGNIGAKYEVFEIENGVKKSKGIRTLVKVQTNGFWGKRESDNVNVWSSHFPKLGEYKLAGNSFILGDFFAVTQEGKLKQIKKSETLFEFCFLSEGNAQ